MVYDFQVSALYVFVNFGATHFCVATRRTPEAKFRSDCSLRSHQNKKQRSSQISIGLQNMIFHEQMFLQTALKLKIIRILCKIPCSMPHALCSQPKKTYIFVPIDTLDQYWIKKINIRDYYMNWLHMKLTSFLKISQIGDFYLYTILHPKCQESGNFYFQHNKSIWTS